MKVTFTDPAQVAAQWRDAEFREAFAAAQAEEFARWGVPADAVDCGSPDPWELPEEPPMPAWLAEELARDISDDDAPFDLVEAVAATVRSARAAAAEQDRLFQAVLVQAAADPVPWVGPDPTLDPLWQDPRGRSHGAVRARRRDLAVRSAAADIGARAQLSDNQVRARAHRAAILIQRCPKVWAACRAGEVSEQNASITADVAAALPGDPKVWAVFDEALAEPATALVPGRYRLRARAVRERVHPRALTERHADAAAKRRVDLTPDFDGMAELSLRIAADKAHAIDDLAEQHARHLLSLEGESRTLEQLRADVLTDLLLNGDTTGDTTGDATGDLNAATNAGTTSRASRVRATVRITIPALTLLGHGDEPATLEGYGPIPLETAATLAGEATSWIRVLTHPITSTILDVDRRTYRVPADMRRMLHTLHPTCVFPGCSRPADDCDYDHRRPWARGGTTSIDNGEPLHPGHHSVKDETRWSSARNPGTGRVRWTSPSGYVIDEDPPPF